MIFINISNPNISIWIIMPYYMCNIGNPKIMNIRVANIAHVKQAVGRLI